MSTNVAQLGRITPEDLPDIRRLPLFNNMEQANFLALTAISRSQSFPGGQELIRQGAPAEYLHVLLDGAVELFAQWNGRESTMAVVLPVSTFILAACMRDAPYLMSARTLEPSRVMLIPASDLRGMFRRDPEFAVAVIEELSACYRAIVRTTKSLKLRNTRERLAAYLLRYARRMGGVTTYRLPVEKRLLASYLGMTPENLSRTFRDLAKDGVQINGAQVTITDQAALSALAQSDLLIDGTDATMSRGPMGLGETA